MIKSEEMMMNEILLKYLNQFTALPERESPLLQRWDESEVKSGVSLDTLMI